MSSLRNRHFFLIDLVLLPSTAVMAFVLRLDASGLARYADAILLYTVLAVPVKLLVFYQSRLYSRLWRHATVEELSLIAMSAGVSALVIVGLLFGLVLPLTHMRGFPRSIPFIDGLLTPLAVGGPRFVVWLVWRNRLRRERQRRRGAERRVLVVGAGDAGTMFVKEMRANPQLGLVPVAFVDDDPGKQGMRVHDLPVLGGRDRIVELVKDLDISQVILAMPAAPGAAIREILQICDRAGAPVRIIPGMHDILSGLMSVDQIREIQIEDLLRREPVRIDASAVEAMLNGRRVLVTGAGGSIGSELCRQVARCAPERIVLLGHGENSIFAIARELRRRWPELHVETTIADVRDVDRLRQVFAAQRPEIVFHAAAHKHVSLMELNPAEAVTNNVLGTANLLRAAEEHSVKRLVLISSDKAVNPISVMGATKRLAELLVQASAHQGRHAYVVVRFGNVLGSRGSVVPIFQEQIARGGPVTVTDPDVCRYFMTIPESVQLVLQAAALGQGGEVFVLDMGEPIRIVDLATDLIHLSGLRPVVRRPGQEDETEGRGLDWDVEVVFTGLRRGEKLREELFVAGEAYTPTPHEKILAFCNGRGSCAGTEELARAVEGLVHAARQGDASAVRAMLRAIVPEYAPAEAPATVRAQETQEGEPSEATPGVRPYRPWATAVGHVDR